MEKKIIPYFVLHLFIKYINIYVVSFEKSHKMELFWKFDLIYFSEVDINPPKQKQKNNQQNGNIHRGFIEYFPSHQLELPFYPKNDPHQSPSSNRVDPNSIPINEAQMAQSDQISEDFYTGKISPRQKSLTIMSPIEIATQSE